MRFLPEELILDVLSRVPTRPVMRLRLVCKAWDKLITDPFFSSIHSRAPISGFFTGPSYTSFTGDGGGGIPSMAKALLSEGFVADASCNGLICFRKGSRLVICDPITQTSATIDDSTVHLPHPPGKYTLLLNVQLLYDPKLSTDFKIVKLWRLFAQNSIFFHVFSSRDGSWKASSEYSTPRRRLYWYAASSSVGEEGAVCWLEPCEPHECALRVYDIGANSMWGMPLPPLEVRERSDRDQTRYAFIISLIRSVSGGRVYLMREHLLEKFVMWRLEGKEKKWVMEFEGIDPVFQSRLLYPLAYDADAEERKLIMYSRDNTMESYHLPSSKREVLLDQGDKYAIDTLRIVPHCNKPAPFRISNGRISP